MTDYKETSFQDGDVFYWTYNPLTLKLKNDGDNGGTTYWCKSRIAIYDSSRPNGQCLVDTYWSSPLSNTSFSYNDIIRTLELEYLGNLNDYYKAHESQQVYYADKDCLNLNHPNSTHGNFYIRRGATKDVKKIERIIKRNIKKLEDEIAYELKCIHNYKTMLEIGNLEGVHIDVEHGVTMADISWMDDN